MCPADPVGLSQGPDRGTSSLAGFAGNTKEVSFSSALHPNSLAPSWGSRLPRQLCLGKDGTEEEEGEQQVLGSSMAPKWKPHIWVYTHS